MILSILLLQQNIQIYVLKISVFISFLYYHIIIK